MHSAYITAVVAVLTPLGDDTRAVAMSAYMKDHFDFLGIASPARRRATKAVPKPDPADVPEIVRALWRRREREYQYVAIDLLASMSRKLPAATSLQLIEQHALDKSWWDTVDGLASIASGILRRHVEHQRVVWAWSAHGSMWVNRLAILHQNTWGAETDAAVLFNLCLAHAESQEFFVRKAIGWALRDYAWVNPSAVAAFVREHETTLSPLSIREATKHITSKKIGAAKRA